MTDIIAPRRRFAPPDFVRLVIRYLSQAAGLVLVAACAVAGLTLASYSPADPSLNFATGASPRNLFGQTGANAADLLFRGVGYAALFLVVLLAGWGWRLLADQRLPLWKGRILALPFAWLALAAALAGAEGLGPWGLAEGPGGWAGAMILLELSALLSGFDLPESATPLLAAGAGLALSVFVLALDLAELRLVWRACRHGIGWAFDRLRRVAPLPRMKLPKPSLPKMELPAFLRRARTDRRPAAVQHTGPTWAAPTASVPRPSPQPAALVAGAGADNPAKPPPAAAPVIDVRVNNAPKPGKRSEAADQPPLPLGDAGSFSLPPVSLLQEPIQLENGSVDADVLTDNARALESVLEDFGVRGEIMTVRPGPVVTLYELQPAPGTKASRVIGLADDIARNMAAVSVRIATIRGKNAIGIELPNKQREVVYLRELLATQAYDKAQSGLPLVLGKDIGGQPVVVNLERMPHLLIAGTTGSGKSVAINTMILSLIYAMTPERCRFVMIDPKMLELSVYDDIPHLLTPVVTDPRKAVVALKWAVREMENRYRAMSTLGVRNIKGYNEKIAEALKRGEPMVRRVQTGFDPDTGHPVIEEQHLDMRPLPYIVVIVDEMADLMLVAGKDIEAAIQRLAQMARAAGIHLIMATQRPSVDVITGTIKANFPTRVSFQVTSKIDSRTILGEGGAEQLLGQGDMLYMAGGGRIQRAHGPFVSDEEVSAVTDYLRDMGEPDYVDSVTEDEDIAAGIPGFGGESGDDLYDQAVNIVLRERKASTSFLQRHLKIGYNRAASLIDRMEAERVISSANHVGKREVLVPASGEPH
ncbi:MAG TPA: DNA translocase FtsK 4TM domain-containing protein [Alphaproteobacteria bacterium]|nr:DNA translocase FtsK 4TM domain-containing protein [Alphaproteobacteria bacterium]